MVAAAAKLSLLLCAVVAIFSAVDYAECGSAPAPAVDCSSLILSMADCLSFVSNGSTVTKPEGTCCAGLKTVLKADAACLCEAFKSSAQLGVVLNVTKASTLPAACKVSAPSVSNCELDSTSPSGAPAQSPAGSEASPSTAAAPELGAGASEQAPAPAPGSSGSSTLPISVGSLLIGLVIATSSSWF
ncbi:non-specific lipid transfer protein GPI-anchored 31 isoform X2 [Ziziphus jujuba]|uniref:Non-specific lipid transfer protein GPI-anchored 31 isoform X1 n=2 Tax=Ziziphus jujuba TaxID=326968 RepID=A0ABM3IWJ0_ZIZJJ|nr:non-specific lipid transfer protein GPI-anchored 31 isoform X1 [Ziziphus jujuba]XP_060676460.1 non-specific lipid transfer protein GPI-anchored 31 isoform X2 [Ziziphus jujuba]KAH7518559.1 hypothetical protein FEM48_Zijuj09G0184400 [Ziziphus jujuba var. spinosa]